MVIWSICACARWWNSASYVIGKLWQFNTYRWATEIRPLKWYDRKPNNHVTARGVRTMQAITYRSVNNRQDVVKPHIDVRLKILALLLAWPKTTNHSACIRVQCNSMRRNLCIFISRMRAVPAFRDFFSVPIQQAVNSGWGHKSENNKPLTRTSRLHWL